MNGTEAESKSLKEKQLVDPTTAPVLKWVELGRRPSWAEVSAINEGLPCSMGQSPHTRRSSNRPEEIRFYEFILPKSGRAAILLHLHDEPAGGHLGGNQSFNGSTVQSVVSNVDAWCLRCDVCASKKRHRQENTIPAATVRRGLSRGDDSI